MLAAIVFAAAVAQGDLLVWAAANITGIEGWSLTGWGEDTVVFARGAPNPNSGSRKRIWLRFEGRDPSETSKSTVELLDIDCAEAKSITLQVTNYTLNNMAGNARSTSPNTIQYALPGTLLEGAVKWACAAQRP